MRAIPCLVALLASTPALAQVSEDITHPLIVGRYATAAVRTMHESNRHDAEAFAVANFSTFDDVTGGDGFWYSSQAKAIGIGNHADTLFDGTFQATAPTLFNWEMAGPGTIDFTGPGIDVHLNVMAFNRRQGEYSDALPPGDYRLIISQSLVSGEYGDTARATAFVVAIPEPSTWAIAAVVVVLLGLHRATCKKGCR